MDPPEAVGLYYPFSTQLRAQRHFQLTQVTQLLEVERGQVAPKASAFDCYSVLTCPSGYEPMRDV